MTDKDINFDNLSLEERKRAAHDVWNANTHNRQLDDSVKLAEIGYPTRENLSATLEDVMAIGELTVPPNEVGLPEGVYTARWDNYA